MCVHCGDLPGPLSKVPWFNPPGLPRLCLPVYVLQCLLLEAAQRHNTLGVGLPQGCQLAWLHQAR